MLVLNQEHLCRVTRQNSQMSSVRPGSKNKLYVSKYEPMMNQNDISLTKNGVENQTNAVIDP